MVTPLIVHTALVHYQQLLRTQRLQNYMQKGLVDRMRDALDRLGYVVEDLNNAADWSDLEVPRSYASLQSDKPGSIRWNARAQG